MRDEQLQVLMCTGVRLFAFCVRLRKGLQTNGQKLVFKRGWFIQVREVSGLNLRGEETFLHSFAAEVVSRGQQR